MSRAALNFRHALTVGKVAGRFAMDQTAMEFPTEEARRKYLEQGQDT